MDRRAFVQRSSLFALQLLAASGCSTRKMKNAGPAASATAPDVATLPFYDALGPIVPIRADLDRIFRVSVCLRPFRAAGPRQDVERVGEKLVIHNYGHGGSGWSLSWGSADLVVRRAMEARPGLQECAVVGCGALGLTAALTAQRMGLRATIYAKERPPYVRSSRATGTWTPDSRIALESGAAPDFGATWEKMARTSFAMYQSYLGSPGTPIEWTDRYLLRDEKEPQAFADSHDFVQYGQRIADLTPHSHEMPAGSTPFPTKYVRRSTNLTSNVGARPGIRACRRTHRNTGIPYSRRSDCTPAIHHHRLHGLWCSKLVEGRQHRAHTRTDRLADSPGGSQLRVLVQGFVCACPPRRHSNSANAQGDATGWNDSNEEPDQTEAENGIRTLQELYARMEAKHARVSG